MFANLWILECYFFVLKLLVSVFKPVFRKQVSCHLFFFFFFNFLQFLWTSQSRGLGCWWIAVGWNLCLETWTYLKQIGVIAILSLLSSFTSFSTQFHLHHLQVRFPYWRKSAQIESTLQFSLSVILFYKLIILCLWKSRQTSLFLWALYYTPCYFKPIFPPFLLEGTR